MIGQTGFLKEIFQMLEDRRMIHFSADCLAAMTSSEIGPNDLILESSSFVAIIIIRQEAHEGRLIEGSFS